MIKLLSFVITLVGILAIDIIVFPWHPNKDFHLTLVAIGSIGPLVSHAVWGPILFWLDSKKNKKDFEQLELFQ